MISGREITKAMNFIKRHSGTTAIMVHVDGLKCVAVDLADPAAQQWLTARIGLLIGTYDRKAKLEYIISDYLEYEQCAERQKKTPTTKRS